MEILPVILGSASSLILFLCLAGGLTKIFQISTDLRELKDIMKDIKRNTEDLGRPPAVNTLSIPLSPEALVRAVHAQSDIDSLTADAPAVPPRS